MTRRNFLGFFLLGGSLSLFGKKISSKKITGVKRQKWREAMYWRKKDEL